MSYFQLFHHHTVACLKSHHDSTAAGCWKGCIESSTSPRGAQGVVAWIWGDSGPGWSCQALAGPALAQMLQLLSRHGTGYLWGPGRAAAISVSQTAVSEYSYKVQIDVCLFGPTWRGPAQWSRQVYKNNVAEKLPQSVNQSSACRGREGGREGPRGGRQRL